MNTADLARKARHRARPAKEQGQQLLEAAFAAMGDAIARGEEVSIQGFGKFKVADRPAREGRNPATGETIQLPLRARPRSRRPSHSRTS